MAIRKRIKVHFFFFLYTVKVLPLFFSVKITLIGPLFSKPSPRRFTIIIIVCFFLSTLNLLRGQQWWLRRCSGDSALSIRSHRRTLAGDESEAAAGAPSSSLLLLIFLFYIIGGCCARWRKDTGHRSVQMARRPFSPPPLDGLRRPTARRPHLYRL